MAPLKKPYSMIEPSAARWPRPFARNAYLCHRSGFELKSTARAT